MKILKKGLLPVDNGHKIYYEVCGNKKGVPFISFHGGPGGSFSDSHKKFFNQKRNLLVLFDQRGCGKSRYKSVLAANTTSHLVADTKELLDHLGIKKINLFGCSWGSTLALCFAIKHPEYVNSIILNGVYLGTKEENYKLYSGKLSRKFVEERALIDANIPHGADVLKYAYSKIINGTPKERLFFTNLLYLIEICGMTIDMTWKKAFRSIKNLTWSQKRLIGPTYIVNDCYLPQNYIVRNTSKINHLTTTIVSGRQDLVCPPKYAKRLKVALGKNCKLILKRGAHSRREKDVKTALTAAVSNHTKNNSRK